MVRIASTLVVFASLGYSAQIAKADLYGYIDEHGNSHISDQRLSPRYELIQRTPKPVTVAPQEAQADPLRLAEPIERLPRISKAERKKYAPLVKHVAQRYKVEAALIHAVISAESAYDPYAVSPRGATGLMQLMPHTAQQYGVVDIYDPRENVIAGAKHLRYLMKVFNNDLALAVAAYNAGHNNVIKYGRAIPPFRETLTYVPRVLGYYRKYQAGI